jgi:hypothetical protein
MAKSTSQRFPVIQVLVASIAVFLILNTPARMTVAGKPTKLFTLTIPADMYTTDPRMTAARLSRGWPVPYEVVDGAEFITKEGHRRFAFHASTPSSFWQRVSFPALSLNFLAVTTGVTAIWLVARITFRQLARRGHRRQCK